METIPRTTHECNGHASPPPILKDRIAIGQAYTSHLRTAGLFVSTADSRPTWDADNEVDPRRRVKGRKRGDKNGCVLATGL